MAKIKDPVQFSRYFGVAEQQLSSLGVLDPTLNVDTKLFIDPLLLGKSSHPEIKRAEKTYKEYFKTIIKLLAASKKENDIAWRAAYQKLQFGEIQGTCLGYGASSIHGSALGKKLSTKITKTAKEIVDLGIIDPDLFVLLPLLEEGIGPDLISDMTTRIVITEIGEFNNRILRKLNITTEEFDINGIKLQFIVTQRKGRKFPWYYCLRIF